MDNDYIRQQMKLIEIDIAHTNDRLGALKEVLDRFEKLLSIDTESSDGRQLKMMASLKGRSSQTLPKGSISFQRGLIEVLQEAEGETLDADEIWERMKAKGVRSEAKRPTGFIGLTQKRVPGIDKVSPKSYRWIGTENGTQGQPRAQERG